MFIKYTISVQILVCYFSKINININFNLKLIQVGKEGSTANFGAYKINEKMKKLLGKNNSKRKFKSFIKTKPVDSRRACTNKTSFQFSNQVIYFI